MPTSIEYQVSSIEHRVFSIQHRFRKLSILPILVPLSLRGHEPFAQNKPNPQNAKNNPTPCKPKTYTNMPPRASRKNKPNQTQSRRAGTKHNPNFYTPNSVYPL
jgi:hypothetical protein